MQFIVAATMTSAGLSTNQQRAVAVALIVVHENLCANIHHEFVAVSQMQLSHLSATLRVIATNYPRFLEEIRNYLVHRRHPTYMGDPRCFRGVRKALAKEGLTIETLSNH